MAATVVAESKFVHEDVVGLDDESKEEKKEEKEEEKKTDEHDDEHKHDRKIFDKKEIVIFTFEDHPTVNIEVNKQIAYDTFSFVKNIIDLAEESKEMKDNKIVLNKAGSIVKIDPIHLTTLLSVVTMYNGEFPPLAKKPLPEKTTLKNAGMDVKTIDFITEYVTNFGMDKLQELLTVADFFGFEYMLQCICTYIGWTLNDKSPEEIAAFLGFEIDNPEGNEKEEAEGDDAEGDDEED